MSILELAKALACLATFDGHWLHASYRTKAFSLDAYISYDAKSQRFQRVEIDSAGEYLTGWSTGIVDGKLEFEMSGAGPLGKVAFRDHVELAPVRFWGERKRDAKWIVAYDTTCK